MLRPDTFWTSRVSCKEWRTHVEGASLALAGLVAAGAAKGNWWITAAFAAIPAAGIVYALKLAGTLPETPSR